MRFGRTLELAVYKPWKQNYIDYAKLKKLLRDDDSAPNSPARESGPDPDLKWTDDDESKFVDELVNVQLEKVHKFHQDTVEKLRDRTAKCEATLDTIAAAENGDSSTKAKDESNGNGKKPMPSEAEQKNILQDVLKELDQITKETNELEKYSRINYTGFLKAAKKHDRKRGASYRVRPLLQVRLAALPFNKEDYGPLLFRLSAMYSFVRNKLEGGDQPAKATENQEGQEEYISKKFWVHMDNLLEVKTIILRRLPVLVYNPQTSKVAEGNQPDPSITSIYFDNSAFDLYSNKVDKNSGSSLRLRWYGQLNNKPEIWIEKKTVTEDDRSTEARFTTKDKYVQQFINGEYHMEKQIKKLEDRAGPESNQVRNMKSAVEEVQDFIKEHDLQPVVRANYTRTAFQIPGDDRVRISLDTDLAFIREDAIDTDRPCRDPDTWHRFDIDNSQLEYPFTSVRKGEISRFPFALLEVKLRNTPGKKSAEWIDDITNSHLVKEAPRFSKFVHGVSTLFEDYVNTFPFWLSQMETDIRRDPQQAFEEEQAKKQKEQDDEVAVGSLLKSKYGSSPAHRSPSYQRTSSQAVISPVGSPAETAFKRSPGSQDNKFGSPDVNRAVAAPTQMDDVVEEPDDDETGTHATSAQNGSSRPSGLKSLFPTFSTSKYAQAKRNRTQLPPGVTKPENWIKDQGPVKVEAKVWLANQRTFIKWQHVSVLLASLSLGLFNAAGPDNKVGQALGIVYTMVAVFAAAWGYGIYMWRFNLITKRSGKDFDAVAGPVVICIGLIIALCLNFGFKYRAVMQERRDHEDLKAMLMQNDYMSSLHADL
ncbi:Putative SPX domain, VTC domain, VTC domain superfamily protein [Septoria linicola]|uniref:SPX domain, VTC domain, VTC domain superfamily protein n=1 Tax=Septoria linicola TaxID=215465 RepID=A0A9Q9EHN9_9PEZI|nr:putative SPX domain, VTC domain, VTC domain superfamily protein [Septoria linicola]USW50219.1 Putative SPX domain, VTC domain, VTC domain superfamily protein [Septoria linicola]